MSMTLAMPAFAETATPIDPASVQMANSHSNRGDTERPRQGQSTRPHDSTRDPNSASQVETEHEKRSCSNMRYSNGEPITPPLERCL